MAVDPRPCFFPSASVDAQEQHEEESASILRMKLEAMTWAAQAKDAALASLEAKLGLALENARANQAKLADALSSNRMLEREVKESHKREQSLKSQLSELRSLLKNAEVAEERLASEMGVLEAEALETAVEKSRLINSLNARLKEKEELLEAARQQLQSLGSSSASPESLDKNLISKLTTTSQNLQALQKKLVETESLWRVTDSELTESKRKFDNLQRDFIISEAVRRQLENVNKDLERQKDVEQDKLPLLKVKGLGMQFKFWTPTSLAVGSATAVRA